MLLQFTVKNYKVFGDEVKLNMIASADNTRENDNIIELPKFKLRVLKSAIMYGANASGKSKLIEAMQFMKYFIMTSAETQSSRKIDTAPFRLSTETEKAPSLFEIVFILDNEMYRYGFEASSEKIVSEWLFHRPHTKEVSLFFRQEQEFDIHKSFKIKDLISKNRVKSNTLLLSKADAENDELAKKIIAFLNKNIEVLSGLNNTKPELNTLIKISNDDNYLKRIARFIENADIGIKGLHLSQNTNFINDYVSNIISSNFSIDKIEIKEAMNIESTLGIFNNYISDAQALLNENGINLPEIHTLHNKYDENSIIESEVSMSLANDGSAGTQKYFALAGPILQALDDGSILVIDELDAKLHPNLVHKVAEIFNSEKTNPKNAQLIFNSHDTNLLSCGIFRRDQIWFIEKNQYGSAQLYSLADFKTNKVRKGDDFEKNYIAGRYGAIPYLGDFDKLFNL
jgi:AAA15 family ATPase/GTPase